MKVAGLFSGIGGLEIPFHKRGASAVLLCDVWESSQVVLKEHFPDARIATDIRELVSLPSGVDVVTAGFPCTDLSQAGRTAGIAGNESGLVENVFRLLKGRHVEWLVLENVRNMLVLDGGEAMRYLTAMLESLNFRWAYRLVDSRFAGVPQRRQRVLFVASRHHDPRQVLFADECGEACDSSYSDDAFGFYWTEGLRGLGWAKDAVPPLKAGSKIGIPSPPAIWLPNAKPGMKLVTPTIEDAEALQGFSRGWTSIAQSHKKNGPRWKLVGNAVTVGVADWLASRIINPGEPVLDGVKKTSFKRWPVAAYGAGGNVWEFDASLWPVSKEYTHLTELISHESMSPLSLRATQGFYKRTRNSSLRFDGDFILAVEAHIKFYS